MRHHLDRTFYELEGEDEADEAEGGMYESEELEMELAAELLEVRSDAELDRFLGNLLKGAISAGKSFVNSNAGRAVGGLLKSAAKQYLPQPQRLGNLVAPGIGGQAGSAAGSWLANRLELEGLSQEDREFESARAFVRFANDTVKLSRARRPAPRPPRSPCSRPCPPRSSCRRWCRCSATCGAPGPVARPARPGPRRGGGCGGVPRSRCSTSDGEPVPCPSSSGDPAGGRSRPGSCPGRASSTRRSRRRETSSRRQLESEAALETELAYELLSVSTEAELEEFLGKLVKGVGKFMKSGVGKAIGGVLRGVAKTALPMVGSALGSMVLPGVGTALGGQLGSMASKLLEAEEAEMLGEQAELEAALRYVRLGADRPQRLVRAPIGATVAGRPRGRHRRGPPSRPGAARGPARPAHHPLRPVPVASALRRGARRRATPAQGARATRSGSARRSAAPRPRAPSRGRPVRPATAQPPWSGPLVPARRPAAPGVRATAAWAPGQPARCTGSARRTPASAAGPARPGQRSRSWDGDWSGGVQAPATLPAPPTTAAPATRRRNV